MQTPVLFCISCLVTVALKNKTIICSTSRCKATERIWIQHQRQNSYKLPKTDSDAQRGEKRRDSSQRRVGCGHQSLTPHTHQINDPDKQAPWNIGTGRWHKAPQKVPGQANGGYTAGKASESALMGGKVVDEFQWGEVSGNEIRQKESTRGRQMDSGYWLQPEKAVWQYQAGVLEMIYYVP